MSIFCWGVNEYGELGISGAEDEHVLEAKKISWDQASFVTYISCGSTHTLFLLNDGKLFSCGNNSNGQLGHDLLQRRPQPIAQLENYTIKLIAAGNAHSLCVNEWGQLYSWGSDAAGQTGQETGTDLSFPKVVRSMATKCVVQVACGQFHSLVLTNDGDLYSFGTNNYGQLGLGNTNEKVTKPTHLNCLLGIPIAFIAAGGSHSFAISKSGAVYGWGKNTFGQLGLNDCTSRHFPTHLKSLRSIGVRHIACGDDFSVFLTQEGGTLTCGSGSFGALGHGTYSNEILPKMVLDLMGTTVVQVTCGKRHTLVVTSQNRIYGFGIGGSGQLGKVPAKNSSTPRVIHGDWSNDNLTITKTFSGGDRSFVMATDEMDVSRDDMRVYVGDSQILQFTLEISEILKNTAAGTTLDPDIFSAVEIIFRSQSCLNGSFLLPYEKHLCCSLKNPGINMEVAEKAFANIQKVENESINEIIWDSITDLIRSLAASPPDVEVVRIYLLLPLYHQFINCKNYPKLHVPFCRAVLNLTKIPSKIVTCWWGSQKRDYFERIIENYKSVILFILNNQIMRKTQPTESKPTIDYDGDLVDVLNFVGLCYQINMKERKEKVPYDVFHIAELNEHFDLRNEYVNWVLNKDKNKFYICNYPFLLDAPGKTTVLQTDQALQMHQAMQNATNQGFMALFFGGSSVQQFIVLEVTRENIVADTIRELSRYSPTDLKKPLKIKFHGEEAEDAGGVRKEFFMLLLKEILDPKYGMFKYYEESRQIWFSEDSFEDESMYALIGILLGLAIYNFTIIHLTFPLALYKKILKEPVELSDLKDLSPIMANSLENVLNYEGDDIVEVFNLTFEVTREFFGETKTIQLKPNGDRIYVTQENKKEFVDLYVDFVLNKAVEEKFKGFYAGFMRVCNTRVLELFKAHELMEVVVGNEDYDWHAFESAAEYKNGYVSSDQAIRWFWEVFHELPLEDKKKFLLFLTGSDRVPITGMKSLKIYIQPTNDDKCLPVAHTCFNLLDLPRYGTKERLKYKLLQSIQQTQGFSLV